MSADNGYVIFKTEDGKYALQMYFMSADVFPPVEDKTAKKFDTLEQAVLAYEKLEDDAWEGEYLASEYGLSIAVTPHARRDRT